jgi:hypothetical protein
MHHHLSRLLRHHRLLLLPAAAASSSSPSTAAAAAAAFSTSSKKPYTRRAKPPPAEPPAAAASDGDGAPAAASPVEADAAAAEAAWQREKLLADLPRPPTIPFQPKVANTVRLVGTIGAPVHLQRTPDGRFSAVSVLVQDRRIDFPSFWCDHCFLSPCCSSLPLY